MHHIYWKDWLRAAGIRCLKTMCQAALGFIGSSALIDQVNWLTVLSGTIMAGILSMLTSLAGLPELDATRYR